MRRLHSASGLFPLGAYLGFHAWEHAPVRSGRDALFARLRHTEHAPLEIGLVLLPLLLHGLLGLWLARRAGQPPKAYASPAFFRLQVATGVITALFIAVHVVSVWLPRLVELNPLGASYGALRAQVGRVPVLVGYVIGLSAVCTHFGQGLGAALIQLSDGRVAPRIARALGVVVGVLLWLVFISELAVYATGARLL